MSAIAGNDVVREARQWIGVRYRNQGRSRRGVDCIGLPACVRSALGLVTADVKDYCIRASDETMLLWCREHMTAVSREALQPGDILVMAYRTDRHMAIVADCEYGGLSIIHAHMENRMVVETRLDEILMARVLGCFRFPEVAA